MRINVKILPLSDRGCTSPKPTVVMVIIVMYKASKKLKFSMVT
jgi:hypothetical protein